VLDAAPQSSTLQPYNDMFHENNHTTTTGNGTQNKAVWPMVLLCGAPKKKWVFILLFLQYIFINVFDSNILIIW
jgi:hypothetical protein